MTLSEFKAWFAGFTECMEGPPNAVQWERIRARVKEIDDKPIPVTVYREYVERFRPYWPAVTYRGAAHDGFIPTLTAAPLVDLGRAEFQSMVTT